MKTQDELLQYFASVMDALGLDYAVVGSVASSAYGDARLTNDIDVVVALTPENVPRLAKYFPPKDFYFDEEAVLDAVRRKRLHNIIHPASGLKIDLILKKDSFVERQLKRRKRLQVFPDQAVYFASPEDVILAKLDFYKKGSSDKHLRDVAGILKISGDEVDRAYVSEWAERLEVADVWEAVLQRLEQPARECGKGKEEA